MTDPQPSSVLLDVEGAVAWLTVNRPEKLNALNRAVVRAIAEAARRAIDREDVSVLVVTGAGEKAFVAGADIAEMSSLDPRQAEAFSHELAEAFAVLERSRSEEHTSELQ